MQQRRDPCFRTIASIPALNPCALLEAQHWADVIRYTHYRVTSAAILSEVGKGLEAPLTRAVPGAALPCRTQRAGQGSPSCHTDKVQAARAAGAIPVAVAPRVAGAPTEGEASPPVAGRHTLAAVVEASPAVWAAAPPVAQASLAVAAVAAVADTTNLPSH